MDERERLKMLERQMNEMDRDRFNKQVQDV